MPFYSRCRSLLIAVVYCAFACSGYGDSGGEVVRDSRFNFTLRLPVGLHSVDMSSLNIRANSTSDEFLVMTARQGNQPFGIVMLAERLNVGRSPMGNAEDFLRKMQNTWRAGQTGQVVVGKTHWTSPEGFTFDELDYRIPGDEFDAAVVTRVGDYLLASRCNAKTEADLRAMTESIKAMRKINGGD